MSKRPVQILLDDMLDAISKIELYIDGLNQEAFLQDSKTMDAVARNLEIIGEASSRMPDDFKSIHPAIEWRKISGLRNRIIHDYFGVDVTIIWQIITHDIPHLKDKLVKAKSSN